LYDVVFLQPFDYVSAHEKHAYDVLATQKESLTALLVVRPSSTIANVSDLKGHRISLPPQNTAISFLVRDWLRSQDLIVGKDVFLDYASSHVSCLQKALLGFGLVCGTAKPVLGFFSEKLGFEFLTIAETRAIPHTLFTVHPRVPQGAREKLLDVILHLHEGTDGKKLMDATRLSPFRHAEDSEYDIVRAMLRAEN
ncbi:MAG: phosphate/phosphite/phosphonate ABC transporter substrate-binding protein, partial [Gammaproteobacteria bacterium]|nr:phosphate/phosphite/phosphonate ABC transporter substrate-binding protein [Gammaproteobacteria bacterium]